MSSLEHELRARLAADAEARLERALTVTPESLVSFADNDYLGLARHPLLVDAAVSALREGRVGGGAARLISGNFSHHQRLEERLAVFKNSAAALVFPTGYAVPCGVIPALMMKPDFVVLDKLCHAALFDGAKLSGARRVIFQHNDANHLAEILTEIRSRSAAAKILVVVESVYSMDGDLAPLTVICDLKDKFGAWLMVDEAHATGVFGADGQGLCAQRGVASRVEIQMGTLGKALGVSGGYVACALTVRQYLLQHARSFIFTTAPPPCLAAALTVALDIVSGAEGKCLRQKLWDNIALLNTLTLNRTNPASPIIPLILGAADAALSASARLRAAGLFVPAVRYPTVPRHAARLRVTLSARHTREQIELLAKNLLI
ncbi:MAG: 8-amino-7-oxononanoate synthase [Verrucomicrobiales bacterium]|nr:8-amino-7-oxononanoate synthase [Verrucomicrobiales bacterium]